MVKCNLYFTSCCSLLLPLLLLQLLTLNCRTTAGLPVNADRCAHCNRLFKTLLLNITELLKSDDLCFGILSDKVVLGKPETLMSCTPTPAQNSSCMMQRHSSFSESECLRNIMKDLVYYEAAIKSYLNSTLRSPTEEVALLSPTLGIIKSLKSCSPMPAEENKPSEEDAAQMWGGDTFNNRQEMCKMMRGFYVRTITINRAMGYIASGDHRK
ncbi:interleukin-12 subunit alpha-like [Solea senegalensis]|uniref:Interleukin-12 subunit alpha n=1 Tax=Solea senegalensis TaxID=28829 RepID=A0AAV6PXG1_SOLSE|nr:interleukin-12 subunit alpha [Solea senegalensis]KAG7479320.1 interleukin-12 subunit alpha-like [Solea senegalensis]